MFAKIMNALWQLLDVMFPEPTLSDKPSPSVKPPIMTEHHPNKPDTLPSTIAPKLGQKHELKLEVKHVPPPEIPFQPHFARPRPEVIFTPAVPTVYLTPEAYKRMCLYVELAPLEVGWLGTVSKLESGDFLIEEVFLVEQQVMAAETELSVAGIEKLVLELVGSGDAGFDKANKLHFWGHSHVRMPTNPSFTDENTMRRFSAEGHEFYVRGIFNKFGQANFDVYYCQAGYRLLDVPWAVIDPVSKDTVLKHQHSPWKLSDGILAPRWQPVKVEPLLVIEQSLRDGVKSEYELKVKEKHRTFGLMDWFLRTKSEETNTKGDKVNEQS